MNKAQEAERMRIKAPRCNIEEIKQGDITVRLTCVFCRRSFTRRSWFDSHGEKCPARLKFEKRFGKQKWLPKVSEVRAHYFDYEDGSITYMTTSMVEYEEVVVRKSGEKEIVTKQRKRSREEVTEEFRAEVAKIIAAGKRPAQVLVSSAVAAEMVEAGYIRAN